ncbi:hypothetical protein [Mycolicibacterium phlei]|uniref:hypothetical protein n=1 Tax=Mycolicibacterium phlei TaxID=1771 RepID=UPI000682B1F6|nr:hypothetical protein [Mycolicibacterium phlei]MBF4194581.1 hypothetical protein [Mycolicibacterium phlei]
MEVSPIFRLVAIILTLFTLSAAPANATVGPDESKLRPNAIKVVNFVKERHPDVPIIGGWRQDPLPDHPSGRALDIMVTSREMGDRVLADLLAHAEELGIQYTLWQVRNHYDHIHVTVYA